MDLDRYLRAHANTWERLEATTKRARRGAHRLTPDELDGLIRDYQAASGQLAFARSTFDDPALTARLTRLVAGAHAVIHGSSAPIRSVLRAGVLEHFPRAVWELRWYVLVAAALFFVPAFAAGTWVANSDAALDAAAPSEVREAYVASDFEAYYSSAPASEFAASVTFNNIQVAVLAFAVGVGAGIGTAALLVFNGLNVGLAGGIFHAAAAPGAFWWLILPHGLLEITAVVVAGATGLRLGWSWIDPGPLSRREALARAGRSAVVVVLGLLAAFGVAGLIEGFVTGSGLPTPVRVGTGVAVEAAFVAYVYAFGRPAVPGGSETADGLEIEIGLAHVAG